MLNKLTRQPKKNVAVCYLSIYLYLPTLKQQFNKNHSNKN